MPTTVLATALPHSLADDAPSHLTVFLTHKLVGGAVLSDFPAAADWVGTLAGCTFSLVTSLDPNTALPLRVVSAADAASWSAVLPPGTRVDAFPTPALSGETWRTNPASRLSDHAVDLHLAAITAAPTVKPGLAGDPVAGGLLETLADLDQGGPLRRLLEDAPRRARRAVQLAGQRLRDALTTIGPLTEPDETDSERGHGGEIPPLPPYQSAILDRPSPVQVLLDDPEADLRVTRQLDGLVGQDLSANPQLQLIVDAHAMRRYYERPEQPQQEPRPRGVRVGVEHHPLVIAQRQRTAHPRVAGLRREHRAVHHDRRAPRREHLEVAIRRRDRHAHPRRARERGPRAGGVDAVQNDVDREPEPTQQRGRRPERPNLRVEVVLGPVRPRGRWCVRVGLGACDAAEIRRLYAVALAERGTLLDQFVPSLTDARATEEQAGIALVDRPGADTGSAHRATLAEITADRGRPIGEGQYVVHDTDALRLPYLPDPYATGVSLVFYEAGAPHLLPEPRALQAVTVPYPGAWPSLQPLRLVVERGDVLGARVVGHEVRVAVPPGEQVRVAVSSTLDAAALEKFGLWRTHLASVVDPADGFTTDEVVAAAALMRAASSGWTWWLTPSIDVRLVHAVPMPVRPPQLSALSLFLRPPGRAVAAFSGLVDVHGSSTDMLVVRASWTEQVDDVTASGPQEVSKADVVVRSPVAER